MTVSPTRKKIFVLGDRPTDLILVHENPRLDSNRNSKYNLDNRGEVTEYTRSSGIDTLKKIFDEMDKEFEAYKPSIPVKACLKTISVWEKRKDALFFARDIGVSVKPIKKELDGNDVKNLEKSDIIVVYDMGSCEYCSKEQLEGIGNGGLILFRTMFPNKDGTPFFKFLQDNSKLANKTILLFNVNELRRGGFNIEKGISWETIVKQTTAALKIIYDKKYSVTAFIVCFDQEGCLIYYGETGNVELFFYPDEIEGDFVLREKKRVFGSIITMQVSLAYTLSSDYKIKYNMTDDAPFERKLGDGVKTGLVVMREIAKKGFTKTAKVRYKEIAEAVINKDTQNRVYPTLCETNIKDVNNGFSILNHQINSIVGKNTSSIDKEVFIICKEIVTKGKTECNTFPYLRYNKLITYDKFEIEQLRNVHNLFRSYIENIESDKPLSICVFGPPGAGKGFVIEQIIASIDEGMKKTQMFRFNVSQLKGQEALAKIFHQARDAGLKEKLPIIFFDEFDSKYNGEKFGWLKYFLAPMQDGEFTDDGCSHAIGRGIFIFAGGTSDNLQSFKVQASKLESSVKANDFLSRLKGHINVVGPNPIKCAYSNLPKNDSLCECNYFDNKNTPKTEEAQDKKCEYCKNIPELSCEFDYMLRRATLLRSVLEKKLGIGKNTEIKIDDNVLKAFIKVEEYLYGSRSLEAIVQTSDITPGGFFSPACINSTGLEMYVNKKDAFISYLNGA